MIENGDLSLGHAKVLLGFEDSKTIISIAEKASNGGMSVRQVENLLKQNKVPRRTLKKTDTYFTEMEISLNERLGRKVKVDYSKNKGTLILEFYDKDDLKQIAEKLARD